MRTRILQALTIALEADDRILAFWEDGSTATGRADQWSDIDLGMLVQDGHVEAARDLAEQALKTVAPFALRFEMPQPAWHGMWQAFYRLEGAPPWLLVDLSIREERTEQKFLEPEIHGRPQVHFDRCGLLKPKPTDAHPFAARLKSRMQAMAATTELFHCFVEKEVRRGRVVDAFYFYQGQLLGRLVEALRMRYSPWRYNFGLRYLQYDLPSDVYRQVEPLCFIGGPDELLAKKELALRMLRETLRALESTDFEALLEQTRGPGGV